jgi:hypothetical protein
MEAHTSLLPGAMKSAAVGWRGDLPNECDGAVRVPDSTGRASDEIFSGSRNGTLPAVVRCSRNRGEPMNLPVAALGNLESTCRSKELIRRGSLMKSAAWLAGAPARSLCSSESRGDTVVS